MTARLRLKNIKPPEGRQFKLDLGCGNKKAEGCLGIDKVPGEQVDYVFDLLETMPWPIDDNAVDYLHACFLLPYFTWPQRIAFMEEAWRVLKPGAQIKIVVPHWLGARAVAHPDYKWPPFSELAFACYDKTVRDQHGMADMKCDFIVTYAPGFDPEVAAWHDERRAYAAKYHANAVVDIHASLIARK